MTSSRAASVKLGDQIAGQLRDEIIAGKIEPGSPLRLMPIAERLDVSTTPVREALAILERQGLLTSQLHRGFRVVPITSQDIFDVYAIHASISEILTERATRRLSDEDLDKLVELDERQQAASAAGEAEIAANLNHDLHRQIHLAGNSPLLLRFLRETTPFVARRQDPDVPGWAQQRIEGHGDILEALRRRDGREAALLMGSHIRRSGRLASEFAADGDSTTAAPRSSTTVR